MNNLTVLGHMGVASAHSSFIGYDPASHSAVAVQINAANPGPAAIMAAEVLGEVTGRDTSPPPTPSVSTGYTFFPYRTVERAGTGERIGQVRVTTQQASASRSIVANEGWSRLDLSISYQRLQFDYRGMTHPMDSAQAFSVTAFLRQRLTDHWGLILVAAVRWFVLSSLHLTVHGGHTLYRRFEFSEGRHSVPGGKYELANGMVYGIDLGVGR